jgi:hypothetical protein
MKPETNKPEIPKPETTNTNVYQPRFETSQVVKFNSSDYQLGT